MINDCPITSSGNRSLIDNYVLASRSAKYRDCLQTCKTMDNTDTMDDNTCFLAVLRNQARLSSGRAAGLQPAAAHDPANETPGTHMRRTCCGLAARSGTRPRKRNPRHTHAPTVLWACSPQRNMAPPAAHSASARPQPSRLRTTTAPVSPQCCGTKQYFP
jgi:hypothetical protein